MRSLFACLWLWYIHICVCVIHLQVNNKRLANFISKYDYDTLTRNHLSCIRAYTTKFCIQLFPNSDDSWIRRPCLKRVQEERSNLARMSSSGASATVASDTLMGYCHTCDRQVAIEHDGFTCSVCHGGFVELFDINNQQPEQQEQPQVHAQQQNMLFGDPMQV